MTEETILDDLPATTRINLVLAVLSRMPMQEASGWSVQELADLAEVDPSAISRRISQALAKMQVRMPEGSNPYSN